VFVPNAPKTGFLEVKISIDFDF